MSAPPAPRRVPRGRVGVRVRVGVGVRVRVRGKVRVRVRVRVGVVPAASTTPARPPSTPG